jgi:hypothetical protein
MLSHSDLDSLSGDIADRLRNRGLRRTRALDLLTEEMALRDKPATIADLSQSPRLSENCDPATVGVTKTTRPPSTRRSSNCTSPSIRRGTRCR